MGLISMESARLRLSIDPALGAGIADFSLLGPGKYAYPLMRRAAPGETNPSSLGSFFMAPWCNRIAGARFVFEGQERALSPTTPEGMAQHGDVRRRAWTILDRSPMSAHLELDSRRCEKVNWPWPFVCRARYELTDAALELDLSVTNAGTEAFPAGCGHHPYFARRLWDDRDVLQIRAPVAGRYPLEKGVATGPAPPRPDPIATRLATWNTVPDEHLDAVFGGFAGTAELRWPESGVTLRITASPEMGHLVVFAPRADPAKPGALPYVAVEPQTQVNGALNLPGQPGTGTVVLQPGQTLQTRCRFEVV
ncbi:MAG: hypothetical protein JNK35_11485 [Phycisphaerae bacterium]|nr:hypothetical protein [Phycisphaerae bacterium]